jgi:thiosulfate/3-mercaptopyruvate sulfurtransferase
MLRVRLAPAVAVTIALFSGVPSRSLGAQASRDSLVVNSAWLAQHINDANLVILHVGQKASYDSLHIPGAQFINLQYISTPRDSNALSLELPSIDTLRARFEQYGVSDNSRIVVTTSNEWISPSTRLLFTLDYMGLGDRTVWLDGGVEGWRSAGHPTTTAVPTVQRGKLTARPTKPVVVDHAYMLANGNTRGVRLIDARSPVSYSGPARGGEPAGHIKGARNLPFETVFGDSSRVLPNKVLTERFRAAGVQPGDTVVAYCHIGQYGTAVLFAARLMGHPVKLYDGSMDDWARRKLPTENSPSPKDKQE